MWYKINFLLDCLPEKAKEINPHYYLPIVEGRSDVSIPFLRAFARGEKQPASSKIWTQDNNSISSNDDRYMKNLFYEFFQASAAVPSMSCSSSLDGLSDWR